MTTRKRPFRCLACLLLSCLLFSPGLSVNAELNQTESVTDRNDLKPLAKSDYWAFVSPVEPELIQVSNPQWCRSPIDRFILARLDKKGLVPSSEASRHTLIRRLYYDLIGLPPSPEEVQRFIYDKDPAAYQKLVDRLLGDNRYGERWARFWLDLARYADTAGYEGDPDLPHAWRYRDWVIDAFNDDKPYDLFIKEQIAGDEFTEIMGAGELPDPEPDRLVALTFLRLAPFTEPRGDETRHEMLSEMTATVGSVFLGLTLGCAKCHDHKYDEIPIKDFYRMKAFFNTIWMPRPERGDIYQIGGSLSAPFYRAHEKQWARDTVAKFTKLISESKKEFEELKQQLDQQAQTQNKSVDELLKDPNSGISKEDQRRYQFLNNAERLIQQRIKRLEPLAMSLRHSYGPPFEPGVPATRIMLRGEYNHPGEIVQAGFPSCVTGNQEPADIRLDPFKRWPTRSRRMALAKWIASDKNPLTARVLTNRLWHWHFGRGIVLTLSDFGKLSGGPSHPKLLDWLALRLVDNQWSIKSIHRLILNSSTYRQDSTPTNDKAIQIDPENLYLWRFRQQRLQAETIRDAVLAVSGRLNHEQRGLPTFPPLPGDIAESVKYTRSKWDTQYGPQGRKRSIYIYQQRTLSMPLMQVFDSVVCDETRPRRSTSVTALQALALYNGDFVNAEAKYFAERVRHEVPDDLESQIKRAFLLAFSRSPTDKEINALTNHLSNAKTPDDSLLSLCRILYNTNEFVYLD